MLAMSVLWLVVLFASRVAYADFHFLSCTSSGVSATPVPTNSTLAVPTSDLASCAGILGQQSVVLQNLTQPVGTASVFSIDNFCGAQRLHVYLASSDLLGVFYSGGDGTLIGECSPSSAKSFSCISGDLSLACTDSWTCFSGICEAPREGSTTTAQLPVLTPSSGSSTTVPAASTSSSGTPSSADSSIAQAGNARKHSKTSIVVGSVLGALCFCLALIVALLIWRRRRNARGVSAAHNPPPDMTAIASAAGTIRPFVATRSFQSSLSKSSGPPPISPAPAELLSPGARGHEAVAEASQARSRAGVVSWRTDALPPSYSHRGEGNEHQDGRS